MALNSRPYYLDIEGTPNKRQEEGIHKKEPRAKLERMQHLVEGTGKRCEKVSDGETERRRLEVGKPLAFFLLVILIPSFGQAKRFASEEQEVVFYLASCKYTSIDHISLSVGDSDLHYIAACDNGSRWQVQDEGVVVPFLAMHPSRL